LDIETFLLRLNFSTKIKDLLKLATRIFKLGMLNLLEK